MPPPLKEKPLKITLINLRARIMVWHHIYMVQLGLMYVSAAAKRAFGRRVTVRLFDTATAAPHEPADDEIQAFLASGLPDLVGIRGSTSQAAEFPVVARMAKTVNPQCLVIAGGPHAAADARSILEDPAVDLVCTGEGEETFVEVIRAVLKGRNPRDTAGLAWRDNGEILETPPSFIADLDALVFPDYSILDLDRYQRHFTMTDFLPRARFTSLFTSRGCHYSCIYCHALFGKHVRYRSVQNVLEEMRYLIEELGVAEFHIIDDIFSADKRRAVSLFNEIVRRNWKIHIAFPNGLRGDRMDEEFIAAAKAAGAYHWALALETASPRLQKLIRKFIDLDKLHEAIALSDKYDVFTTVFNMLGFPTETEEEMRQTLNYSCASAAHAALIFVVTPYKGTALHDQLEESELPGVPDSRVFGYTNFSSPDRHDSLSPVPRFRIEGIIHEGRTRFYFGDARRIKRMIGLAPQCHSPGNLAVFLERQLYDAGYTIQTVPDPEVARLLADLVFTAIRTEPQLCAHLRVPPEGDRTDTGERPHSD